MRNCFIGFYEKDCPSYKNQDLCIIIYKRTEYLEVIDTFKDTHSYDLDHWYSINWGGEFYDILIFYKGDTLEYAPIYIMRDCSTPYKVKNPETGVSEPRGWFYDRFGKEKRYTGIGNSIYLTKDKLDTDFSVKLIYMLYKMYKIKDNYTVESNLNTNEVMLLNYNTLEEDDFMSLVQDNSMKKYDIQDKKGPGVFGVFLS